MLPPPLQISATSHRRCLEQVLSNNEHPSPLFGRPRAEKCPPAWGPVGPRGASQSLASYSTPSAFSLSHAISLEGGVHPDPEPTHSPSSTRLPPGQVTADLARPAFSRCPPGANPHQLVQKGKETDRHEETNPLFSESGNRPLPSSSSSAFSHSDARQPGWPSHYGTKPGHFET